MRSELSCLPLALLFLANVVPSSYGQTETTTPVSNGDADTIGSDVYFELHRNFSFNCADVLDLSSPISWEKNGTAIEKLPDVSARVVLEPVNNVNDALLKLAPGMRASDADVGNYTCRTAAAEHTWQLKAKPRASMHSDTNVVEGQKLKLTCKLIGRPYPPVEWSYSNMSENMENATAVKEALGERATTKVSEQGVENGELTVEPAQRSDAGWYRCTPLGQHGTPAVTRLRVKDMYAALWPFLGICAEVLVLCAIILVYEKRRTKPELDDSDTDNHDQKKS